MDQGCEILTSSLLNLSGRFSDLLLNHPRCAAKALLSSPRSGLIVAAHRSLIWLLEVNSGLKSGAGWHPLESRRQRRAHRSCSLPIPEKVRAAHP
jgi:hypothetical protein